MKETGPPTEAALALTLARQVDEVCCRFEAAWKEGPRPRIEDYLGDLAEPARDVASWLLTDRNGSVGRGRHGFMELSGVSGRLPGT
jgi:hypothetical protein